MALYNKNTQLREGIWLGIANKPTDTTPAPKPQGNPSWLFPGAPTWTPGSQTAAPSYSGIKFQIPAGLLLTITNMRVWLPEVGAGITHRVISTINNQVTATFDLSTVGVVGWNVLAFPPAVLIGGDVGEIYLETIKSLGGDTSWTHTWNAWSDTADGVSDPGTGSAARGVLFEDVAISDLDSGLTDRSAQLAQIKVNDSIRVEEASAPSRYEQFTVEAVSNQAGWYTFQTSLAGAGSAVRSNRACNIRADILGGLTDAPYVSIADYWIDEPAVSGFQGPSLDSLVSSNNGYGVDVYLQEYAAEPDWDIQATLTV